ncbi:hypothetical protein C0Z16_15685 [Paraburkholderia rhynchosiae]|uniref:Uncharacterized protein n=1 Tax=Paraburkholderia rhynchosiae TaxID=487049 RepID=A0ABX4V3U1_9BURK|nr:hypothetical protein C0Z16_15685 [Paraburkholderia rhynchosiae]
MSTPGSHSGRYPGFGPTLACKKLRECHGINLADQFACCARKLRLPDCEAGFNITAYLNLDVDNAYGMGDPESVLLDGAWRSQLRSRRSREAPRRRSYERFPSPRSFDFAHRQTGFCRIESISSPNDTAA